MKIVCEACSAKYSISDDKVQGKVFKIRCKKCSNIIVVRGNAGAGVPSEATTLDKSARVLDYGGEEDQGGGGDAVWHVVIDQDQVGPMSAADVQRRFQAGEIDGDTYIWREGFADWLPVSQVDQFAALFSGGGASAAVSEPAAAFAAPAAKSAGASAVSDLFGQDTAASTPDDDGEVFGARKAAAADNPSKLRGERGENSVLFSLSNLAQLASDPPRSSSSSSSAPSSSSSAGAAQHGGGEGSGLIDIRSMASAYLTDKGPKAASPAVGSAADLPVFSSTGFGESAAVLVPISRPSASNNNRLLYGLIGLVGLLAVVAVVMVVVVLKGDSKPQVVAANTPSPAMGGTEPTTPATVGAEPGSASAPSATKEPASAAGTVPPSEPTPAVKEPAVKEPAAKEPTTREPSTRETKPRDSTKKTPSSGSTKTPSKEPEEPKAAPPPKKGSDDCDAVACLVDPSQPCCKKSGGSKPSSGSSGSKPDSNLPEQLDSSMIKAGIDKVKGRAQACGNKSSAKGSVKVRIKATPDGKVGSVEVVSSPDDALGSCVASALRGATFAKTQRGMGFAYTLSF